MPALTGQGRHPDPDGRRSHQALAECEVGDAIYGTEPRAIPPYSVTRVLDHWSTIKPAYRVTLEDGTELVASGDHRFLTDTRLEVRDRHEQWSGERPYLTTQQQAHGHGACRGPRIDGGVPARVPLRDCSRRRSPRLVRVRSPGRSHGNVRRLSTRARRPGGVAAGTGATWPGSDFATSAFPSS